MSGFIVARLVDPEDVRAFFRDGEFTEQELLVAGKVYAKCHNHMKITARAFEHGGLSPKGVAVLLLNPLGTAILCGLKKERWAQLSKWEQRLSHKLELLERLADTRTPCPACGRPMEVVPLRKTCRWQCTGECAGTLNIEKELAKEVAKLYRSY